MLQHRKDALRIVGLHLDHRSLDRFAGQLAAIERFHQRVAHAVIRAGGKGWDESGAKGDTNCVIPDNSYAPVYDETVKFFKANGALNPATAGTVQNLGLMAQKAEEYGSHPTTFEIAEAGTVKMILEDGSVLHEHGVEAGDIWRSASARKAPIEDWVHLAIDRQAATWYRAIFWLD